MTQQVVHQPQVLAIFEKIHSLLQGNSRCHKKMLRSLVSCFAACRILLHLDMIRISLVVLEKGGTVFHIFLIENWIKLCPKACVTSFG